MYEEVLKTKEEIEKERQIKKEKQEKIKNIKKSDDERLEYIRKNCCYTKDGRKTRNPEETYKIDLIVRYKYYMFSSIPDLSFFENLKVLNLSDNVHFKYPQTELESVKDTLKVNRETYVPDFPQEYLEL